MTSAAYLATTLDAEAEISVMNEWERKSLPQLQRILLLSPGFGPLNSSGFPWTGFNSRKS